MEIRGATLDDVDAIVSLGRAAHEASTNCVFEYAESRAKVLAASCVCRRNMVALVACIDSQVVGFILGHVDSHPYIDMTYATDLAVVARTPGAGRLLLRAFEKWAFSQSADQIILGVVNGVRDLSPLYKRIGYQQVGGMFTKNRRS